MEKEMQMVEVLLLNINNSKYAIDIQRVEEVIHKVDTRKFPEMPDFVEGVIEHRNNALNICNLRKMLGMESFYEEQLKVLKVVEGQHVAWVENLKNAIEGTEDFTKTFNPHACYLGKWIDEKLNCSKCNNKGFVNMIHSFVEISHSNLHTIGKEVFEMDDKEKALKRLNSEIVGYYEETLNGLKKLEDNIDLLVKAFERIIIFDLAGTTIGLTVDEIDKIIEVDTTKFCDVSSANKYQYVRTEKSFIYNNEIVLYLELDSKILEDIS
jgi:chemotaxis signal transduction protein